MGGGRARREFGESVLNCLSIPNAFQLFSPNSFETPWVGRQRTSSRDSHVNKNTLLQRGRPWRQKLQRPMDPCFVNGELGPGHLQRGSRVWAEECVI